MNQQKVALDSCVVIDIMEKPKVAKSLKSKLRGKSIKIVLSDIVLGEVNRVRGYSAEKIISKITLCLGRKVEFSKSNNQDVLNAHNLTEQFQSCHNGDNKILSLCQARNFVLVTFDKMLLRTSSFIGVAAFHPKLAAGI